jgi:CRP-like cAMP-binding protein
MTDLVRIQAFDGFDERARNAVGAMMRVQEVTDGSVVVEQGARLGGAYVILDGEVRLIRELPSGRSVGVRTLGAGQMVGLLSCLDSGPRNLSVVARGTVRIAEIPRDAVVELLEGRTSVALRFQVAVCRTLFNDLRFTNRRLAELAAVPDRELTTTDLEPLGPVDELDDLSASLEPLDS